MIEYVFNIHLYVYIINLKNWKQTKKIKKNLRASPVWVVNLSSAGRVIISGPFLSDRSAWADLFFTSQWYIGSD